MLSYTDTHGDPDLSPRHRVSAGGAGTADAYDWNFVWKVWDALRNAAYFGTDSEYALGDTPEHRALGTWSDGVPIVPLKIQTRRRSRPENSGCT